MSLPAWGVWIEIFALSVHFTFATSLPAWGVWIEIWSMTRKDGRNTVAPRMGSVD